MAKATEEVVMEVRLEAEEELVASLEAEEGLEGPEAAPVSGQRLLC